MQDRELNKKVLKKQREGNWTVCSKSRRGKKSLYKQNILLQMLQVHNG